MSNLSAPHFHNEEAAYAYVEARIWPEGPMCPRCGGVERISKMQGKSTRVGAYKCYQCRKPFTVKIGTIFEDSKVSMRLWLQAMYLIAGSKKRITSNQLHRILGVTLKTAWFMSHRIRDTMRSNDMTPFGGEGGVVEVDETFIGKLKGAPVRRAFHHKMKVLALVDRASGQARTMVIDKVEGYFSLFKRGMKGVYQFCGEQHLHRYLAEFEFRYNNRVALGYNDSTRADALLNGVVGKRLTYQTTSARA